MTMTETSMRCESNKNELLKRQEVVEGISVDDIHKNEEMEIQQGILHFNYPTRYFHFKLRMIE